MRAGALLLAAASGSWVGPAHAQGLQETFASDAFPDESTRRVTLEVPALAFRLAVDIPLTGPLTGEALRLEGDGSIAVPVEDGVAIVAPDRSAGIRVVATDGAPEASDEPSPWVEEPESKRRFRSLSTGHVVGQKCCGLLRRGWHRIWRLRVPGGTAVPPLTSPGRVYVGALDNQIYGLRSKNGHRLWTADVGRRVSRPLALWEGMLPLVRPDGTLTDAREARLVLALPDGGNRLLALDARTGRKVAVFELPEGQGRMVGSPIVTPAGLVAVARQRYTASEASLIVLDLEVLEPAPEDGGERAVSGSASTPAPP